jgi:hypothetical protein
MSAVNGSCRLRAGREAMIVGLPTPLGPSSGRRVGAAPPLSTPQRFWSPDPYSTGQPKGKVFHHGIGEVMCRYAAPYSVAIP